MAHTPGWAIFVIVIVLIPSIAFVCYFLYVHYRARRRGLPAPSINPFSDTNRISGYPSGLKGWYNATLDRLRNRRSAPGAYESTVSGARGPRRGFGSALDPDEAWDTRVGNEADGYGPGGFYEEQELGLHSTSNAAYEGSGYRQAPRLSLEGVTGGGDTGYDVERGRSRDRQRELDQRYAEETGTEASQQNPFGDGAERSDIKLRGVSPRPHEEGSRVTGGLQVRHDEDGVDATERKSLFKEQV